METAAGTKSDGLNQSLQNRVREVFRKSLQWKWDREVDPASNNPKQPQKISVHLQGEEISSDSSQKRWPHLAPAAIQKFRRLFSSDGSNVVSSDRREVVGIEKSVSVRNSSIDELNIQDNSSSMVRMKTQEKESGVPDDIHPLSGPMESSPGVSIENRGLSHKEGQECATSSKMEVSLILGSTGSLKLDPSHEHNLIETPKASDQVNISRDCDYMSDNHSVDCDVNKKDSIAGVNVSNIDCKKALESSNSTLKLKEREVLSNCENGKPSNNASSQESKGQSSVGEETILSNADISSSEEPPKPLKPSHQSPLYLTFSSAVGPGNTLTRKSPVTVQEWVDSIPLTSHLEEYAEESRNVGGFQETASGAQDLGDVCPSVTVRPASGQSGNVAEHKREAFSRDPSPSIQSDTGSHGSSVDSFLDARRPDPEEVLLGLGFGGPLHNTEAEVSRIPARFLQPSKVKGVAIDDFLRYQQDLIETFESGYSGYRGLTGGAQIPSVIVAKIMEKLREHERESSTKSSAGSSPRHRPDTSKRRFSRAAQRITILTKMKSRDTIACASQAQSVLNPDNRKFLDNQGSKSPEVSRKRMIIGHRSFTFDGEGQLIETETNTEDLATPEMLVPSKPPPPRPLVHKDSIISSATSLTSYESDSDTDDASGNERNNSDNGKTGNHPSLQRFLSTPVASGEGSLTPTNVMMTDAVDETYSNRLEKRRQSLPSASDFVLNGLYVPNIMNRTETNFKVNILNGKRKDPVLTTSTPDKGHSCRDLHRVNSAPTMSPLFLRSNFSMLGVNKEENLNTIADVGRECSNSQRHLKLNTLCEKEEIPETLLMISEKNTEKECETVSRKMARELSHYEITDFVLPSSPSSSFHLCEVQGSLAGEEHSPLGLSSLPRASDMYLDRETRRKLSLNLSTDSCFDVPNSPDLNHRSLSSLSSWESERTQSPQIRPQDQTAIADIPSPSLEFESSAAVNRRRGSLKRQQKIDEEDMALSISSSVNLHVDLQNKHPNSKGDSFEMEELTVEEERQGIRAGSAHSDSSGFQEEQNKEHHPRATLSKQLSESEPLLYTQIFPDEQVSIQTTEHLKRLSLPVIRVQDESGHTQWQGNSFYRENVSCPSSLRRSRSLPSQISRLVVGKFWDCTSRGSVTDSIGNMFSSCSDESVIHLPRSSADKSEILPLQSSIMGCEGESEAFHLSQECCELNTTLKNSLEKCHIDLSVSRGGTGSFLEIRRDFQNLKEAHNRIKIAMQQVQSTLCSPACSLSMAVKQVAQVIQHQNSLNSQLEHLSSNVLSTIDPLSVRKTCENFGFGLDHHESESKSVSSEDQNKPEHSSESCALICEILQKENQRLQDLVLLNVKELAQVRALLEKIFPYVKE